MIGFVLAAAGLLGSLAADGMYAKVLLLTIAVFGADMTLPPSWAFCIDIGRNHAGAVSGTMNMAGNIGLVRDEPGVSVSADLDRLTLAVLRRRRNAQRRRGNSVDASASRSADRGRSDSLSEARTASDRRVRRGHSPPSASATRRTNYESNACRVRRFW